MEFWSVKVLIFSDLKAEIKHEYAQIKEVEEDRALCQQKRERKIRRELGRKLVYKRNNEFYPKGGLRKTELAKST